LKLAFREYGSGTPLIILHGLFGQSDNWNTLAKKYAEHDLHVFTVDQRNHGLSPHSDTFTFESMADDLHEFIAEHDLKSPVLMGHSMGGKTVLHFEQKYKNIASRLIIADISARAYPPHHQDVLKALNAVNLDAIHNRKEAEAILSQHISDFGTKQFLLKNLYWKHQDEGLLDWRFNLKVITHDYDNVTKSVPFFTSDTPVLIINGEKSQYVTEEDVIDYKARFSNCRFITLKDAGHWVHAEKPQQYFDSTLGFIKS
jgi:esterase